LAGPVSPLSLPRSGLRAVPHEGEKVSVRIFRRNELVDEFYARRPTQGRGDRATRDLIVARLSRA
jgi:hypothetical protein